MSPYLGAVVKVGIETIADGFHLKSGLAEMDRLFFGGGTFGMFETVWLILIAASFGALTGYTGMIQRVVAPLIRWANSSVKLILATMLTTVGLNILTADSYVAILRGTGGIAGVPSFRVRPTVVPLRDSAVRARVTLAARRCMGSPPPVGSRRSDHPGDIEVTPATR